jgi:hypothetical protein
MTLQREMTPCAAQVQGKLPRVVDHAPWEALARQTGFGQRSTRQGTGTAFRELMTTARLADAAGSLDGRCDLLRQRPPLGTRTPPARHQRMLPPQASPSGYAVGPLALRENRAAVGSQHPATLLAPFGRVLLEDSTQCRWHAKLAEACQGSGGRASPSPVTSALLYDYTPLGIHARPSTEGTAADPARAAAIVPPLRADDLVVRAWGSCCLPALRQIANQQACCLRRLCPGGQGALAAHDEAPSLPLVVHLQPPCPHHAVVALDGYVGQEAQRPGRLIA